MMRISCDVFFFNVENIDDEKEKSLIIYDFGHWLILIYFKLSVKFHKFCSSCLGIDLSHAVGAIFHLVLPFAPWRPIGCEIVSRVSSSLCPASESVLTWSAL